MSSLARALFTAALALIASLGHAAEAPGAPRPTVILVHGAFADAASWQAVIEILQSKEIRVVAMANPLRGPAWDSAQLSDLVSSIEGPVVLVGHSYGGVVITDASLPHDRVKALVYVSAFAPDAGETVGALAQRYPGSTLNESLGAPVALASGGNDLYIDASKFASQFAADVPPAQATIMAATQRPIRDAAFVEPLERANWHAIPSWAIYGAADKNIPAALLAFMAQRSEAKSVVVLEGASHVPMVSRPREVAQMILRAVNGK
jgi:pimeloyl-ACP methyl ester carboxylesterase